MIMQMYLFVSFLLAFYFLFFNIMSSERLFMVTCVVMFIFTKYEFKMIRSKTNNV